jgi:hypothetical protein
MAASSSRAGHSSLRCNAATVQRRHRPKGGCCISFAVHPLSDEEFRAFRRMQCEKPEGGPANLSILMYGLGSRSCRPSDNVRYLRQFGEHILRASFTALDPKRSFAVLILKRSEVWRNIVLSR